MTATTRKEGAGRGRILEKGRVARREAAAKGREKEGGGDCGAREEQRGADGAKRFKVGLRFAVGVEEGCTGGREEGFRRFVTLASLPLPACAADPHTHSR
eukprot:6213289-Pleurochrysis_carterae.AAC.2